MSTDGAVMAIGSWTLWLNIGACVREGAAASRATATTASSSTVSRAVVLRTMACSRYPGGPVLRGRPRGAAPVDRDRAPRLQLGRATSPLNAIDDAPSRASVLLTIR
jgi:hypothetical protein